MNADVSRRVFVGSVAAGLPLVAEAVNGVGASSAASQAHAHAAAGGSPDHVFDHALRELAAIHSRVRSKSPNGEDARAVAALLRTAAVHSQELGIDGSVKKAVADLIRSRGRDSVLYLEVDKAHVKARLKQYGIEADDRWFDTSGLDYVSRTRILDEFQSRGLTGTFTRAAKVFDTLGAEIDKRGREVRVVRVQRDDAEWWAGFCAQLQTEIMRLGMDVAILCAVAFFLPAVALACALTEGALGIQSAIYLASCV